jgi:hypothetical protein
MERKTFVKVATLGMAFVMMSPTLITGLTNLMPKSQPVVNSAPTPQSQDAQFAAEENGYLAVLEKEPNNSTASKGLGEIAAAYVADQKVAKAIDIYQKMIKVAPQARNVKLYQQRITELQKQSTPLAGSPSSKP